MKNQRSYSRALFSIKTIWFAMVNLSFYEVYRMFVLSYAGKGSRMRLTSTDRDTQTESPPPPYVFSGLDGSEPSGSSSSKGKPIFIQLFCYD